MIYGSGGFAREVLELIHDVNQLDNRWEVLGFLDDDFSRLGTAVSGLPVLGSLEWLDEGREKVNVVLGIGSPAAKMHVVSRLRGRTVAFPTLVHPNAIMSKRVSLGEGVLVTAGNVFTTDIRVDDFVTVNLACTIGHDVHIGGYATVLPGVNVSGSVRIAEGVDVGTGSTIIQGVRIGEWSIIGAGSVVIRDIPANCTAVGSPAKAIKLRSPGWHQQLSHN